MRTTMILCLFAFMVGTTSSCGGTSSPAGDSLGTGGSSPTGSVPGAVTGGTDAVTGAQQGGTGGANTVTEGQQGGTGGANTVTEPSGVATAKSSLLRVAEPTVSADDGASLLESNTAFAIDLYRSVRASKTSNVFLSPYSISSALDMTYAGARGNTEVQITQALHITLPQDRLHAAMNQLDSALKSRQTRLDILNAAWVGSGASFLPTYLDVLAQNYGAGMYLLDLEARDQAVAKINQWVAGNTQGKIPALLDTIAPNSALVLTNAIYFNAAWQTQFDPAKTKTDVFTRADATTVDVSMMQAMAEVGYGSGQNYQAVEIPYSGKELSFVAIAPRAGASDFEASLTASSLSDILGSLSRQEVNLSLPKFSMGSKIDLIEQLSKLGVTDAFTSGRADFSGMDGAQDLFVSKAVHEAKVEVSEVGTEAAGATAVVVTRKAAPTAIALDHPFLFLVHDIQTRAILFLGWVADPTAG